MPTGLLRENYKKGAAEDECEAVRIELEMTPLEGERMKRTSWRSHSLPQSSLSRSSRANVAKFR